MFLVQRAPTIDVALKRGEKLRIDGRIVYSDVLGVRRERAFEASLNDDIWFLATRRQIIWTSDLDPQINFDRRVEVTPRPA